MKALTFTIELVEHMVVATPVSGDENSAASLDYIPGSVVRGALAQAYGGGKRTALEDDEFRRLFFGQTCFLNAYLEIDGRRSMPTPLSWCRPKAAAKNSAITDLAIAPAPKTSVKRLGELYVSIQPLDLPNEVEPDGGFDQAVTAISCEVQRQANLHIQQQDRLNATTSDTSSMFRYVALAAGQRFAGLIVSEDVSALEALRGLLEGASLKLGKSRSAGYGEIGVSNASTGELQEYVAMTLPNPDLVVVTLLSDVIARDPATGALASSLSKVFGVEPVRTFARTRIVGGFNLAWGLPAPQAMAIASGSVFVFTRTSEFEARLRESAMNGIGERRIDGFGRIAVDLHTQASVQVAEAERRGVGDDTKLDAGTMEFQLAQQMVDRIWRATLDAALRDAISASAIRSAPNKAQLSRIRTLVQEVIGANDMQPLRDLLKEPASKLDRARAEDTGMRRTARDQFEKARISIAGQTSPLIRWLTEIANKPDAVFKQIPADDTKRPAIGGVTARNPNAVTYAARLIDGVLRRAAREGGE